MKRILIGATVGIALLGVVALPVLAAVSGAGKDNLSPNTTVATQKPKFSAPVYDVSYTDPFFGPVRCTGVHLTFVHPAAAIFVFVRGIGCNISPVACVFNVSMKTIKLLTIATAAAIVAGGFLKRNSR